MGMSAKHYEAIAGIIKNTYDEVIESENGDSTVDVERRRVIGYIVDDLVAAFSEDNPNKFDEFKFRRACDTFACPACAGAGRVVFDPPTMVRCDLCNGSGHLDTEDYFKDVNDLIDDVEDDADPVSFCPACGEPIDYCQGHGEIGDPMGFMILHEHNDGEHRLCNPRGCEEAAQL